MKKMQAVGTLEKGLHSAGDETDMIGGKTAG
jgi:hypothetical protein